MAHTPALPCYVLEAVGPQAWVHRRCGGGLVSQEREKRNGRSQASFDRNEVESARGSRARFNRTIAAATGHSVCVLKTRFGNSGDEGRQGRAQIRCGPRAGWRDGSERLC